MKVLFTTTTVLLALAGKSAAMDEKSSHRATSADFLVKGLAEIEPAFGRFNGDMYAGQLPFDADSCPEFTPPNDGQSNSKRAGELTFWLFEPDNPTAPDTLTIWLNGGPGCSSFNGGFFENAPVTTPHRPAGSPPMPKFPPEHFEFNEQGWTFATNMLYVEQPAGIGFSRGPFPDTEDDLSQDFYHFLNHFYCTFPHMQSKRLFIFGESYAGMYVPSIAHRINLENKRRASHSRKKSAGMINIAGIAIGDGWMDGLIQSRTIIDYAYWHGMIDSKTKDALHLTWKKCVSGHSMNPPFHDFTVPDDCNISGAVRKAAGGDLFPDMKPNIYDVTTWDMYKSINEPESPIDGLFNNPEARKILHFPSEGIWRGCIRGSGRRRSLEETDPLPGELLLAHDHPVSVVPYLAELLDDAHIRVLIYNADRDMSITAPGSEMLLDGMVWSGSTGWKIARRGLWVVDGLPAGYSKSYKGLDFLIVLDAGHLMPHDVPVPALDLITRMVTNKPFSDYELPAVSEVSDPAFESDEFGQDSWQTPLLIMFILALDFVAGMFCWSFLNRRNKSSYQRLQN